MNNGRDDNTSTAVQYTPPHDRVDEDANPLSSLSRCVTAVLMVLLLSCITVFLCLAPVECIVLMGLVQLLASLAFLATYEADYWTLGMAGLLSSLFLLAAAWARWEQRAQRTAQVSHEVARKVQWQQDCPVYKAQAILNHYKHRRLIVLSKQQHEQQQAMINSNNNGKINQLNEEEKEESLQLLEIGSMPPPDKTNEDNDK